MRSLTPFRAPSLAFAHFDLAAAEITLARIRASKRQHPEDELKALERVEQIKEQIDRIERTW